MKYLLLLSAICLYTSAMTQVDKKMNVLYIIADDLTSTAVSSYGNKECHTPNIDGLASEGVQFSAAYCQYPVCGPSRASIMFGYYPNATKTFGYVSGRENVGERQSWSQLFKDNGYLSSFTRLYSFFSIT